MSAHRPLHPPVVPFATDAARWQAVLRRDPAADGAFYYSVRTTGIFCRPTCPARKPRRENVRFYRSTAAARRGGFRPCLRCRPEEAAPNAMIVAACRQIAAADTPPQLVTLAATAGLSTFHFQREFKRVTGITPKAYAAAVQAERLRAALGDGRSVTAAMQHSGHSSTSRLYATAERGLGMQPREFQRHGAGVTIRFAVGECLLGSILVAATERGICAIALGDRPQPLLDELQQRFSQATLIGGDRAFERTVAQVVACIEHPRDEWRLPLDIRGTAFQQRVWHALARVPVGETVTYSELAARLGSPQAVRAVAAACAANPVAVAIPCHRVVRKGGALAGYRWGIARKRALLEREARD